MRQVKWVLARDVGGGIPNKGFGGGGVFAIA